MASKIKKVDWEWTQGNYGFSVIFRLVDINQLESIDIDNYNFFVNVQKGENETNLYTSPCRIVDAEEKKVEYEVQEGELDLGDEYYYIELQALHKDLNPNDAENEEKKISSQEVIRVFVRKQKEH